MEFKNHIKNEHIRIRNEVNNNEIFIDGDIGASLFTYGYDFAQFKNDIAQIEGDISINIKSYGGDLYEAWAIYDYIRNVKNKVTTRIVGATASAGTVIALAGDVRLISENSRYLIHKPMVGIMGNSDDFKRVLGQLESLDKQITQMYAQRSNLSEEEVLELMIKEEFISAEKALEYGFVDSIIENKTQTKVTNQTHEKVMSEKLLKALNVDNEDKGLEVLNDLQSKAKQLDDKFVELQILNEEKEDKDKEIEDLKAEIAKLKDKLKAKEVEESEEEAENIKDVIDKAIQNKKITEESRASWEEFGDLKGSKALAKMIDSIPTPTARNYPIEDGQAYATKAELTKAFKAGSITAGEFESKLKLFK